MRCLYCGKELALLKRWTGGGEFCSDAHRQRYQEEYNQLALKRLLQAQPENASETNVEVRPVEAKSKSKADPRPEVPIESGTEQHREQRVERVLETATPAFAKSEERYHEPSIAVAEQPAVVQSPPEAKPPAPLGEYIREAPRPAFVEVAEMVRGELEWMASAATALPVREGGSPADFSRVQLVAGEPQPLSMALQFRDCVASPRERRLEFRDFVRTAPIVEVNLTGGERSSLEMATQPLEMPRTTHAPGEAAALWQESGAREFAAPQLELGELTRLAFSTTGLQDDRESVEAAREFVPQVEEPVSSDAPEIEVEVAAAMTPEPEPEPEIVQAEAPVPEPLVQETPPLAAAEVAPAEVAPEIAPVLPVAAERVAEPMPNLVRRAVPLTLHGLAAGRGKPVQVFTAPLGGGVSVQLPRSNALPLRPLMVLGPRMAPAVPASQQVESKPEVKKAAPAAKPDPRTNGKHRKPGVRVITPEDAPAEKPAEKKAEPVQESVKAEPVQESVKAEPVKEAAKAEPVKEAAKAEPVKEAPTPEPAKPEAKPEAARPEPKPTPAYEPPAPKYAPLAAPLTTVDLGLPKLDYGAAPSGWSRMSGGAKIGIAAAVALMLAGAVLFLMKGGSGSARAEGAPRVMEAGPALPTTESGWITNWGGGEAGVRKTHDISVLRPSLNLTDYRVDLQGQIESKGMGWIVRAMNPKNYYVLRLEVVKPGLEPTVHFVRFAMVGGEENSRVSLPLRFPVRVDTMYKIRTDVVGNRITTWIQEQKVDDWTDDQVKTGGAGLYYERGERASLKGGLNVVPLILKN